MRTQAAFLALLLAGISPTMAQAPASGLSGIRFLVGTWNAGQGTLADTGGTTTGQSTITAEAGGAVLLRRDHTDLFDRAGKPSGGFDQIMMIYPEGSTLHADYSDGRHVIHYDRAAIEPGHAVTFTSSAAPGQPVFRLGYRLLAPNRLGVSFSMAPPGSTIFRPVADGTLSRTH
ncbi:hypothetical protein [Gluconacetobacter asukensis]|uniref:DUF1579 domain-containing protein n=1 Tax=Gluconacetobacter asukensis TaxID=1017181 RepID=A0A7W4J3M5_9PROT|nr:hypothetical protein [Gluconacetobacter asukensis]MBB2174007.1 hypothetical protein [Gluconacetobacter asukensis]